MRKKGLNVFIYLRKSRRDIEEEVKFNFEFDTLERHRKQLLSLAKKEEHNILNIYEEIVSGEYISERPQIQKMLRDLETYSVNAVLVMDLDRLGRGDMLDQGIIYRTFRQTNTLIITPTEIINPSDDSHELNFSIKSLIAREELKTIKKRLMRGRKTSASEGKFIGSKPPYGYTLDKNLTLIIDEDKVEIIRSIFNWTIEGQGRWAICHKLNQMGIAAPSGGSWTISSIKNIITNHAYYGTIVWQKKKNTKKDGKYITREQSKDNWTIKTNAHEGIITEEIFINANKIVKERYRPPKNEDKQLKNPLAGIVRCEICNKSMWRSESKKKKGGSFVYLQCHNADCIRLKKNKPSHLYLVESRLIQSLQELLDSFKLEDRLQIKSDIPSQIPLYENLLNNHTKELDSLLQQKNSLYDFLEKGIYTIEVFLERQKIISEREKSLKEEIDNVNLELQKVIHQEKNIYEYIPKAETVIEAYKNTNDVTSKNQLLKSILTKVTLFKDPTTTDKDNFSLKIYPKI